MSPIEVVVLLCVIAFWGGVIREWRRIQGRLDKYVGKQ